jgi:hypothetical protein
MMKKAGSGPGSGVGPVRQSYGSADPDLDPYQYVTDPHTTFVKYLCDFHLGYSSFVRSFFLACID